jgi:hypothetical protein
VLFRIAPEEKFEDVILAEHTGHFQKTEEEDKNEKGD